MKLLRQINPHTRVVIKRVDLLSSDRKVVLQRVNKKRWKDVASFFVELVYNESKESIIRLLYKQEAAMLTPPKKECARLIEEKYKNDR